MQVQFSPSALDDLSDLLDYYRDQEVEETGKQVANELIDATEALTDYPQMGRIVPEFNSPSLRELIRPPYRVVYRIDSGCISIIRIWRNERLLNLPEHETVKND